jgi:hypothetical protein
MKTQFSTTLVIFVLSLAGCMTAEPEKPKGLNERATISAWDALNAGKYEAAITNANLCIDEFQGQAIRLQEKLQKEKVDFPTGEVTDEVKNEDIG